MLIEGKPVSRRSLKLRWIGFFLLVAAGSIAWARYRRTSRLSENAPLAAAMRSMHVPSITLQQFQESLGVDTHLGYTDGLYADVAADIRMLQYLGIQNVRDGIPGPNWLPPGRALSNTRFLMAQGIHFTFIIGSDQDIPEVIRQADELARQYPGMITAFEGPNEINNQPVRGQHSNQQNAEALQRSLYAAVHADTLFSHLPVLYFTGGSKTSLVRQPGLADMQNFHPYARAGQMPYKWILQADHESYTDDPGALPKATTESGYSTAFTSNFDAVDPVAQADLIFTEVFDLPLTGHFHNYLYQLREAYPNFNTNADTAFGLFQYDGNPKPAAQALHAFAQRFPPDPASEPRSVDALVDGLPETAHVLATTEVDGTVDLWMWNEIPVWDPVKKVRLTHPPVPVSIQFPGDYQVTYFSPRSDVETAPIAPGKVHGKPYYVLPVTTAPSCLRFTPTRLFEQ